jgi:hypothetical protein
VVGLLNANLCLNIPKCFLLISREFAYGVYCGVVSISSRTSLVTKDVCGRGIVGIREIFGKSFSCFGVGVLRSISLILFISFC